MPTQSSRLKTVSGTHLPYLPHSPHFVVPPALLPGPKFLTMILLALPVAVVAMASVGLAQRASGLIAGAWFVLVPCALYNRWVTLVLPAVSGAFLVLTVAALPFNSPAFVVDFWVTAVLFLLSLPRRMPPTP